jgi:TRAP-type mannitol/chloroaromatic compound transport system permease large subunit
MELLSIAAILLGFLGLLLGAGVWIAVALMATGWAGMQFVGGGIPAGSVLATTVWGNSASWSLAALPLFIWMGEILFRTRLSEEMFRGFAPWLNWLPGRLMHVNVLACGVFGSVSGSSAATCATVAKIALPELKKRGYDEGLSLGSLAGAGTLGILIPPSITMVVYAVQANVSIIQVFLAGFLPGLLVMVLYSGYIAAWSLANPERTPPADPPMSLRKKIAESLNLIPCLLLIAFVFLSLLMGWATATECAAWGVLGSLAIAWWQGALTWVGLLGQRHGRDAGQLHDPVDPGGRLLHGHVDGLYRHPVGARDLGQQSPAQSLCADRGAHRHVHRARHGTRRHFHDRANHGHRHSDGEAGRLRSGLVRYFPGAGGGNG